MTAEESAPGTPLARPRLVLRPLRPVELAVALVLALLPVAAAFAYVRAFSVNVPFWDEWALAGLLESARSGQLNFETLWHQHNEHRILIPKSLMVILAVWSQLDVRWCMYAGLLVLVATATLLLFARSSPSLPWGWRILAFFPVTLLLFSLRQWENLLWGWQLQFFLCVFFAVLALWLLTRSESDLGLDLSAVLAAGASSVCLAAGLSTWPAGLLVVLLRPERSPGLRWRAGVLWVVATFACLGIYLRGYEKPSYHPDVFFFIRAPVAAIHYFAVTLGSALATDASGAAVMGAVMVGFAGLATWMLLRGSRRSQRTLLGGGLLVFGLSATALVSVGRAGSGVLAELPSRYTTLTALLLLGSYFIFLEWHPSSAGAPGVVVGLFLTFLFTAEVLMLPTALNEGRTLRTGRTLQRLAVQCYRLSTDAELKLTYPDPAVARQLSAVLERLHAGPLRLTCPMGN